VHHITSEAEDAGVVYCEMQARENQSFSILFRKCVHLSLNAVLTAVVFHATHNPLCIRLMRFSASGSWTSCTLAIAASSTRLEA
jgi:hypothetical protein